MTTGTEMRETMRAVLQDEYGTSDILRLGTAPRPQPGPGEVLVEVRAAGVDRGVWHLMTGLPYLVRLAGYGITKPKSPVPGMDVSGVVTATGEGVSEFEIGDEVFGIARGAYAEYAVAPESKLSHKPANVTFEQAAVAAISGITALQALTEVAALEAGQRVLVIGASGGVGSYAVQIAKAMGAHVTGVASGRKADLVRGLGADDVVDYTTTDYLDGSRTYDVVVDTGGLNPVRHLRRAINRGGTLVIVGGEGGGRWTGGVGRQLRATLLSLFVPQRLTSLMSKEGKVFIDRVAGYMQRGQVVPPVGRTYRLDDAAEAISDLEAGRAQGKSVIVVG